MKRAVIALGLLLAGCASGPRVVSVPVPTPCFSGAIPAEPEQVGGRLTGNAERDIGVVAGSALRLRLWGRELRAALTACQAPTP